MFGSRVFSPLECHRPTEEVAEGLSLPKTPSLLNQLKLNSTGYKVADAMFTIIFSLFSSIRQAFRARVALQTEILALRHQLLVLQRSHRGRHLRLRVVDRLLWVWLSRLWNGWQSALLIVKPETVIAWHRMGFRLYWRWKSRHPQGRPSVSYEVINLIRKMSLANP